MAYDEGLAQRMRECIGTSPVIVEKKMFGGLAFMYAGHLCCGVVKGELMVRTGPDAYAAALQKPHAREMDFTGRPMKGMVMVAPEGVQTETALQGWVDMALTFAQSLPPKQK
ncbi:MAG: TfoX/Sxy family protein [Blastocatellia bacterium]